MRFVFAREKDGRIHFRRRHPNVSTQEVMEVFESRMAIRKSCGSAWKGIGHARSGRFLVVVFKWGVRKETVFALTAYPAGRRHVEAYVKTMGGVQ
ncbi:MAG: hypothetical protein HYY13_03720 [Nitrospirae bacterium]|nr:hypothetical protein [Nitrospirota bacterium]